MCVAERVSFPDGNQVWDFLCEFNSTTVLASCMLTLVACNPGQVRTAMPARPDDDSEEESIESTIRASSCDAEGASGTIGCEPGAWCISGSCSGRDAGER